MGCNNIILNIMNGFVEDEFNYEMKKEDALKIGEEQDE